MDTTPPSLTPPASPARRQRRELAGLTAVLVVLALLLAALRWDDHGDIDDAERSRLSSQAFAIEQSVGRELLGVHAALRGVRASMVGWSETQRVNFTTQRFRALCDAMAGVRSMHWLDAEGRVIASSLPQAVGSVVASRAYFREMQAHPDPMVLYVSEPFNTLLTSVYTLNLSVVLTGPDGDFEGALSATLDPDYFDTVLAAALYSPDMRAALAHAKGRVVLQAPPRRGAAELDIGPPGSLLERHMQGPQPASVQVGTLPGSDGERLAAFRTLHPEGLPMDQPLVLALSRERADVFAPWRRQTALDTTAFVAVALAAWWALRALQRRRRELEDLAFHSEARHRLDLERVALVLRGGDLALWDAHIPTGQGVVNERWYSMLGYAREDIAADESGWRALLHPDDQQRVLAAQAAHLVGETEAYEAVYRLRHRSGHWVWVLDRGRVVERDAKGHPVRMVGTHLDISERVQAEEALRRNEQSLAITLHSIGDGVVATDPQGRVTRMNAAAQKLTGWTLGEALGRPLEEVFRIFNARTREVALDPVSLVLERGETVDMTNDTVLVARDGTEHQVADSAAPIRDARGAVVGVVLVFSDVTERYRTLQTLREGEARLRISSRMARLGSWRADLVAAQTLLSPELMEMLEIEAGPAKAQGWSTEFVAPQHRDLLRGLLQRCAREGAAFDVEIEGLTTKGRPLHLRILVEPERNTHGTIVALQGAVQDLTERHQAQQHLRRLEDERVALERQLHESQKMESIGTLAGGIAHDFNNILPAILGNTALAQQDLQGVLSVDHPAWRNLEQIRKAALRARSLVQQILTFSRREPQTLQPQALRPVVEETLALLRATLPASVRLDTRLADAPLVVDADATQLQQVLMNLCTNAWHALPEGRGRIELGLDLAEAPPGPHGDDLPAGPCAHLWVRDDGAGMDEATLQRIFDPFFTTKPVGRGTGLGLSVVHGIVRSHRGRITVESRPEQGSTFHLYLPLRAMPAPEQAAVAETGDEPGAGQRVLYVDDDEVMVLLVQRLLERAGYSVVVCESAAQAMQQLRVQPFELLVTDYNMPEMSGMDLADEVRTLWPHLPIIITSGNLTAELRQRAKAVGIEALLRKENTLEALPGLVARVLAGARDALDTRT